MSEAALAIVESHRQYAPADGHQRPASVFLLPVPDIFLKYPHTDLDVPVRI